MCAFVYSCSSFFCFFIQLLLVMVMVELSGGGVKEGMARVIMLQYAVAPIILCLTMAIVVGIASGWS